MPALRLAMLGSPRQTRYHPAAGLPMQSWRGAGFRRIAGFSIRRPRSAFWARKRRRRSMDPRLDPLDTRSPRTLGLLLLLLMGTLLAARAAKGPAGRETAPPPRPRRA